MTPGESADGRGHFLKERLQSGCANPAGGRKPSWGRKAMLRYLAKQTLLAILSLLTNCLRVEPGISVFGWCVAVCLRPADPRNSDPSRTRSYPNCSIAGTVKTLPHLAHALTI